MKQFPEKVNTGGLTGQGFINLLGRPRLALLPLVLREAVQNSWDARIRRGSSNVRFSVRIRSLKADEEAVFRKVFDQKGSIEQAKDNVLAKQLRGSGPVKVLELADYGTVGLAGATRPDLPSEGVASRFVDFFFDVGRAHEESGDGGTYGFGRSSLYTAGSGSMVLADSLVQVGSVTERRLMACRIGKSFEVSSGWKKGRYSGRHFWGRERGGVVQPIVGRLADALAGQLGLPARTRRADTGTTILIPWPVDGLGDGRQIAAALLHHLWPKMVPRRGEPTMAFSVEVDGEPFTVRDPSTTPEYRLFVQALGGARSATEGPGVHAISTLRPKHITGYLGVIEGPEAYPELRNELGEDEENEGQEPQTVLNQVVLMRPSELVVRYLPVTGTEQSTRVWAGVFICSDAQPVRLAFARSEPPAHDDWIADRLDDRQERYLVRQTVKLLLPAAVRTALGVSAPGVAEEPVNGRSLAGTSARFASLFLSGDGQGPSTARYDTKGHDRTGARRGGDDNRPRLSEPVPVALHLRQGVRVVTFKVMVQGQAGSVVTIGAKPSVHAEGLLGGLPQGLLAPAIVEWRGGVGGGDRCQVTLDGARKDLEIDVAFLDEYGVTLDCQIEGQES